MVNFSLQLKPETEERLRKILSQNSNQEAFAQNIIDYQIAELKRGILNIRLDIKELEEKYRMESDGFYQQFQSGVLEDSEDFLQWAGLIEMLQENQRRLEELE